MPLCQRRSCGTRLLLLLQSRRPPVKRPRKKRSLKTQRRWRRQQQCFPKQLLQPRTVSRPASRTPSSRSQSQTPRSFGARKKKANRRSARLRPQRTSRLRTASQSRGGRGWPSSLTPAPAPPEQSVRCCSGGGSLPWIAGSWPIYFLHIFLAEQETGPWSQDHF